MRIPEEWSSIGLRPRDRTRLTGHLAYFSLVIPRNKFSQTRMTISRRKQEHYMNNARKPKYLRANPIDTHKIPCNTIKVGLRASGVFPKSLESQTERCAGAGERGSKVALR